MAKKNLILIFLILALYKMKLKPNDVIMIGDSYEKDIIGANNAGIESIHLQV